MLGCPSSPLPRNCPRQRCFVRAAAGPQQRWGAPGVPEDPVLGAGRGGAAGARLQGGGCCQEGESRCPGPAQTAAVKQGRAELARCFMLVLFLLVWPDKQRAAGQSFPDSSRNNTNTKHSSSSIYSAQSFFTAVFI